MTIVKPWRPINLRDEVEIEVSLQKPCYRLNKWTWRERCIKMLIWFSYMAQDVLITTYKILHNICVVYVCFLFFVFFFCFLWFGLIDMWQSLYVHIPARHPSSFPELELPTLLQVCTTLFLSLLFFTTH